MSRGAALAVEHLSISFGRTRILRDLSFRVETGQALAIIGPNGSGKSLLLKALIGAVPAVGCVTWAPGARLGYVPQKLDLERDIPLTGIEFLRAKAQVTGVAATEVSRALAAVELGASIADQPLGTLSGGQFQRLLLAFALMGRPSVLLFDEPTAGVDEPGQGSIYGLIGRLAPEDGLTVLLVSHELNLVYRYADNVLCLSRAKTYLGPPLEVLTLARLQEVYGRPVQYHPTMAITVSRLLVPAAMAAAAGLVGSIAVMRRMTLASDAISHIALPAIGIALDPTAIESLFGLGAAALVILFVLGAESRLVITLVSLDLARTAGINLGRIDLSFLFAFALTVALGLRFLGVLLMGSLIIIPAATAKHLAHSFRWMKLIATAVAMTATVIGALAAQRLHLQPGPLTIMWS